MIEALSISVNEVLLPLLALSLMSVLSLSLMLLARDKVIEVVRVLV